ncbi:hypothetical protein C8F01DRAFT_931496, partial [Mycena amicta]
VICAREVLRCVEALERLGVTGAAGLFFVTFEAVWVLARLDSHHPPTDSPLPLLTTSLCVLFALNIHDHYFLFTRVRRGFVD